ncbi:DUF2812 domain-containing protein [Clostridium sp. MB05]
MRIGNIKILIIDFVPYEYKKLQRYLEEMALKGWKLEGAFGKFFKFKRIDPMKIKYYVDVVNGITFLDGKNSNISLEHRKKFNNYGWNFVCEIEKVQIFCSEDPEISGEIYGGTLDKFIYINKASLKEILLRLLTFIILGISQYNTIFNGNSLNFLANNTTILLIFFIYLCLIINITDLIRLIRLYIKGDITKESYENVEVKSLKWIKFKSLIMNLAIVFFFIIISLLIVKREIFSLGIIFVISSIFLAIYIMINLAVKYTNKNTKKVNIIMYFIITIVSILFINKFIINSLFNSNNEKKDLSQYALTLKDFNDEIIDEQSIYIDENKSFLAHTIFYSANGKNRKLSYELFESNYNWVIEWNFNKMMDWFKDYNISYSEIKIDLPADVKVYRNNKSNNYILVSDKKIIEIFGDDENIKCDMLKKTYDKIFR